MCDKNNKNGRVSRIAMDSNAFPLLIFDGHIAISWGLMLQRSKAYAINALASCSSVKLSAMI
jgi:hypothetical protein